MRAAAAAAIVYFAAVFAAGFALGPVRVMLVEPRIGAFLAVVCEAPFLAGAMWAAARAIPPAFGLGGKRPALLGMGLVALALVLAADVLVGVFARGIGVGAQLQRFMTPEGLAYAALLVLFAAMPMIVDAARDRQRG